jgi:Ser/Thr protein kinase RdoA (MazF antagonist)
VRAIRDLVGSGEGIFGLADSYPPAGRVSFDRLQGIEERCVAWRWKLRRRTRRVRRTHGDFHPYNVLFRENVDFTLLDGSRGTEGESADDLAAMSINYLFGGVTHPGTWREGFAPLWSAFWSTYLATTADWEVLEVIAPFFAWRALVLASPVWYPDITDDARERILSFAETVLDAPAFDLAMAERFVR